MGFMKYVHTTLSKYLNEQHQTETNINSNFKKWFGDSKIVKGGQPTSLYHGSYKYFTTFNMNSAKGVYTNYNGFTNNKNLAKSYGDNIYEVFLKIDNPYIIDGGGEYIWKVIDKKNSPDLFFDELPSSYDGIIFKNVIDFNGCLGSKYVLDVSDIYMVRNPFQIKSTENDGSWDINDDNIYS